MCHRAADSTRNTPSFKQTIGLFSGMVPDDSGFGRDISFVELIQAIAESLRESYRNQRFPLSEITRLAGMLQAGRKRLFDIALSFETQNYSPSFGSAGPGETTVLNHGFEQTPFAVFVRDCSEFQDVQIDFSYNLAYFDAEEVKRIQGWFQQLTGDVLADPDRPIGALDLVPAAERQRLVVEWNATGAPVPDDCSIVALFAAAVASCRDAVAVRETGRTMTFAELDARSDRVAARLEALVAGPEPVVGLAGDRSAALIAGVFGVLKAGAVFLPLDPAYPDDRLRFMIDDSGVTVLLADAPARARLAPLLDGKPIRLLALEADLPHRRPVGRRRGHDHSRRPI